MYNIWDVKGGGKSERILGRLFGSLMDIRCAIVPGQDVRIWLIERVESYKGGSWVLNV